MPEQVTRIRLPEFQENAIADLINRTQALANSGGRQYFPDSTVAGFDPAQTQGQQQALNLSQAGGQIDQSLSSAVSNNAQLFDLNNLLGSAATNPAIQDYRNEVVRKGQQTLAEALIPAVRSSAILNGGLGGSADRTGQALAAERVQREVGGNLANYDAQTFQTLLSAAGQALQRAPGLAKARYIPAQATTDVGDIRQRQQQAEIAAAKDRFDFAQNEPYFLLDQLRASTGQNAGQTTSSTTSNTLGENITAGLLLAQGLGVLDPIGRKIGDIFNL